LDEQTKRLADVIIEALKLLAIIIGGIWVYFRFRREDTHSPKVSFDIEIHFFSNYPDASLAEFLMVIKNSGLVKHSFKKITLRVRGISKHDAIGLWGDTQRVEFPHRIVNDADVLYQKKYGSIFVEPGVTQTLTFNACIPAEIRFVLARAEFEYKSGRTHSAERVFELKPSDRKTVELTK
jgi:hypothetical protein